MKQVHTIMLAAAVAEWLRKGGCIVSSVETPDGFDVHYTLKNDMKPQPAVQIRDKSVIFPQGSQEEVLMAFLDWRD